MSQPVIIATGCYSTRGTGRGRGVELLTLDPDDGGLEPLAHVELEDPSFVIWDRAGDLLHAVTETEPARLVTLRPDVEAGRLEVVGELTLHGAGGCHLAPGTREGTLLVADYGSGHVESVGLDADGLPAAVIDVVDHGEYRRGQQAHPHQVRHLPGTSLMAVPDLGLDRVHLYRQDSSGHLDHAGEIALARGSGPRHVAPDHESSVLYIACENSGELATAVRVPEGEGDGAVSTWTVRASAPASGRPGANAVSHVEISRRENHAFIANRGPDTLSAFSLGPMRPELVAEVAVGAHPRHFTRLENGLTLVAAQDADRIDVLHWDGRAFEVRGHHQAPSVTCVQVRP